ncbi:unnamed protein product [Blepharisma stoltei]|uniref:Uncharacterized protein n=1 Tax=Blepharisma stoltei TaxID=1481888 RepID=A0AAU9JF74_9CILI|nr:unnamed protein product [Blepharisma stoltei]
MGLITNALIIGGTVIAANKVLYNMLFAKQPIQRSFQPIGNGKSLNFTYQHFGRHNWISPVKLDEIEINDLLKYDYIDFRIFKSGNKILSFRPYPHIERLNEILRQNGFKKISESLIFESLKSFKDNLNSKEESIIRAGLWIKEKQNTYSCGDLTFSLFPAIPAQPIDISLVNCFEYPKHGLRPDYLLYYGQNILDGWKSSIFLVENDGALITPKFIHPAITPFPIDTTVTRDSIMKIFSRFAIEKDIKIDEIFDKKVKGAFLANDTLTIQPISSISFNGKKKTCTDCDIMYKIHEDLRKYIMGKENITTKCEDNYTEEFWSHEL